MNRRRLGRITVNTASPDQAHANILILYTGGTFGMTYDAQGVLIPFDFSLILHHLPTLRNLALQLTVVSFDKPIDSSNIQPAHWQALASLIVENYNTHDGFVILHGTDTMAYTASALSFMLDGLTKPVVFTGAQLPISEPRSDARENLITALEVASAKKNGLPLVPEVCIYFNYELLRGNRSKKVESMQFDAFDSNNYPPLARAGVKIDYNFAAIRSAGRKQLRLLSKLDTNISILKLFPGMDFTTLWLLAEIDCASVGAMLNGRNVPQLHCQFTGLFFRDERPGFLRAEFAQQNHQLRDGCLGGHVGTPYHTNALQLTACLISPLHDAPTRTL